MKLSCVLNVVGVENEMWGKTRGEESATSSRIALYSLRSKNGRKLLIASLIFSRLL